MVKIIERVIKHYGVPRRSGRYPWGSGGTPYQDNPGFLGYVSKLRKQGLSDAEIAEGLKITSTELRAKRSIVLSEQRASDAAMALRLKEKGYSLTAIGERMGKNESSIRSLLDPALKEKASITAATAMTLKDAVDTKGFIDIGVGVENHLAISRTKLNTAVAMLKEEGYTVHEVKVPQPGTGKMTTIKVLAPPETTSLDVFKGRDKIKLVTDYSEDGGRTFIPLEYPKSVDSNRILVRYKEDGGSNKDGVIELRRNVDDISIGENSYSQVRVGVDNTHFMKGMAMYSDDIPKGYDIVYNISKPRGSTKDEIFKEFKDDPDNPFGTTIRQRHYLKNGKNELSLINTVGYKEGAGEEGSWEDWSRNISSQILSKQTPALAKKQLGLALQLKREEYDEIMSLTNPAVKKALLKDFSDGVDSDSVHLKAASLPRQSTHVLLPINSLKETEVYAPNYINGESVVLIRHPHGGIFEIPDLKVNNKNPEGKRLLGDAPDAIGINTKVAQRLSGADFDGDAVIVIPNRNKDIKTSAAIKGLQDFDTKTAYPYVEGMRVMTNRMKQQKMGDVSNLITDMTIKGASQTEIARAIKHSMVVIDSEKHRLNYQQSYIDNNISELKQKYQGRSTAGAATLISRAASQVRLPERKEGQFITGPDGKTKRVYIDPVTGKKLYEKTGRTYEQIKKVKDPVTGQISYVKTGKVIQSTTKSTRMEKEPDAFNLSSGTPIETIYASHANALKDLANKARLSMINTGKIVYSPSARKTYDKEVSSLNSKLALAIRNKPLERQALLLANKMISAKRRSNPDMDQSDLKKVRGMALIEARSRYKAKKEQIIITDREWEAIQSGAISNNALNKILANCDLKRLKIRALPRTSTGMSSARVSRARSMLANGYTRSEIAQALGVSVSTLSTAIK